VHNRSYRGAGVTFQSAGSKFHFHIIIKNDRYAPVKKRDQGEVVFSGAGSADLLDVLQWQYRLGWFPGEQ
jgi:hypothetical protein